MRSTTSVLILSVSDHESVRSSREMLLQYVGYSVVSMCSECALAGEIPCEIKIAIIGQTIDDFSASRLTAKLRATKADIRILRLTKQYSRPGPGFDGACFIEDGPGRFLDSVADLVEDENTEKEGAMQVLHCRPTAVRARVDTDPHPRVSRPCAVGRFRRLA